jgi:tol-pal system protein YbgF
MRKSSHARALWLLGTSSFLVVGCTHHEPADRGVDKLRADIAKIEAERDKLNERVLALEASEQRRVEATPQAPRKAADDPDRRLPVVRLSEQNPDTTLPAAHGEAPDLDTDSADLRPIVHASGSRGATEHRGSKDGGDGAIAFSPEAKRDYDIALALARGKQYDKALQAFTAFLVRFPDHPNAENAMYWRGECFYATGAYARAVEEFEGVIARFPYGNKTPDALLKLGLAQEKVGAKEQAQKTFAELKDRYPKSEAARQVPHP